MVDPGIRFPGQSKEYPCVSATVLLKPRPRCGGTIEEVAAQRRALPPGGVVPKNIASRTRPTGARSSTATCSSRARTRSVVCWLHVPALLGDTRPGPKEANGAASTIQTPCASSHLDSGLARRRGASSRAYLNLRVVAKSDPDRIRTFAGDRGSRHLRLLSSRGDAYNRDYNAETPEGERMPVLNASVRDGGPFRHASASDSCTPLATTMEPGASTRSGRSGMSST